MIYDLNSNKSYCLNSTAGTVFNYCDGETTIEDLKLETGFSDEIIYLSLDEIKKNDLIEPGYSSPFAAINRREVIKRIGFASMIALPVISALVAPGAINAASNLAAPGTILSFSTPGTPQTNAQCVTAISNGAPRCASNRIQAWNNNGTDAARNCDGRCLPPI